MHGFCLVESSPITVESQTEYRRCIQMYRGGDNWTGTCAMLFGSIGVFLAFVLSLVSRLCLFWRSSCCFHSTPSIAMSVLKHIFTPVGIQCS